MFNKEKLKKAEEVLIKHYSRQEVPDYSIEALGEGATDIDVYRNIIEIVLDRGRLNIEEIRQVLLDSDGANSEKMLQALTLFDS